MEVWSERGLFWEGIEGNNLETETRYMVSTSSYSSPYPHPLQVHSVRGVGEKIATDQTVERAVASVIRFPLEQKGDGIIQTRGQNNRRFC